MDWPTGRVDVVAGLFAGWVHAAAALTLTADVGGGRLTITTLRLDGRRGPVAKVLLAEAIELTGSVR